MNVATSCIRCGSADSRPLLGGTDLLYGLTAQRFNVVECPNCGMARLSPRPDTAELGRFYPPEYWFSAGETAASHWTEAYRRTVLRDHVRFVLQSFRETARGRVLDVGSGGGLLAYLLRAESVAAFGFDWSPLACALAWKSLAVPSVTADLTASPFAPRSFSLVTMFHVLEHLPDPAAYLAAARDLLEPRGRLIVQVPNIDSWQARFFGSRWNGIDIPRHLHHFRPADLGYLLGKSGFDPVRWKFFSLRDNPAGLATTLAPRLDPMARRIRGLRSNAVHYAAYLALTGAAVPFAMLEAACRRGSTMMVEARLL